MTEDLRPPFRQQFDNARDPYTARNALGITSTGGGGGSGAPDDAEYIVAATDPVLTNERVLTNTATITWDFTTPGQAKASTAAGGGNVSNSGTPTLGQYAKWVTATTIQGVNAATVLGDIGAQPLDADLTAIAALTGTNTIYYRSAANTWSPVVVSTGLSFSGGTLTCTVSAGGNVSNSGTPTAGQYGKWVTATTIQGVAPATVLSDIGAQPAGSYAVTTRLITAGAGLTGGGDLSADRTLDVGAGTGITVNANDVALTVPVSVANGGTGSTTAGGALTSLGAQPLDADLTAIAALTGTDTIYYRSAANTWSAVNVSTGLAFSGGNLTATASGGGVTRIANVPFLASGTWTKNANLLGIQVEVWGAGGGGSIAISSPGGGGGGYARKWYSASALGATVTVTIGAGAANANGGTTTFAAAAAVSASGGVAGAAGGSGSGGDLNLSGRIGNGGLSGATVGPGGNAPLMDGAGPAGGSVLNGAANTGGGGASGGAAAGGSGLCLVTEFYSV